MERNKEFKVTEPEFYNDGNAVSGVIKMIKEQRKTLLLSVYACLFLFRACKHKYPQTLGLF